MAVLLALISSFAIGGADFIGGRLSARTSATAVVTLVGSVDLVLFAVASLVTRPDPSGSDLAWAALAGVLGALSFVAFLRALAKGPMSIVSPFTALVGVATPFVAGLLAGERPSGMAWIGCVLGVIAVGMSAAKRSAPGAPAGAEPATLLLAAASGLGFGGFVIALEQTSTASGVAPIVVVRLVGVALLAVISLTRRLPVLPPRPLRRTAIGMGVLQSVATGALILALHDGALTLVGVVSSLYPVTTVLLATWILGEQLDRLHRIGVALALIAVISIAAG